MLHLAYCQATFSSLCQAVGLQASVLNIQKAQSSPVVACVSVYMQKHKNGIQKKQRVCRATYCMCVQIKSCQNLSTRPSR